MKIEKEIIVNITLTKDELSKLILVLKDGSNDFSSSYKEELKTFKCNLIDNLIGL